MSGTQQPQRDELRLMDGELRSVAEESCTPLADVFFADEYAHDAPEDFHLPPPGAKRAARIVLEAAAEYSAQHAPYSHNSSGPHSSGPHAMNAPRPSRHSARNSNDCHVQRTVDLTWNW